MNEFRTLKPGEKIEENGFYSISLDRHHSQPCVGPSVTSGVLRKMELETPSVVWATSKLNPDPWPSDDSTALMLGRAMAALVEGGSDELKKHYLVADEEWPKKPTAPQIKAYEEGRATEKATESVEWWVKIKEDGRDVLDGAQLEMIMGMGSVLTKDPAACAALDGEPEVTMAYQDEETGLWLLARPDLVSFAGLVSDYKKVNTQGNPFNERLVDKRISKHGYDMQMAFACEVFERLTGGWPELVGLVFQHDKPPHDVILREISEEDLRIGQFRNRRSIQRFRECLDANHWPGPGEHVGIYNRPTYERDRLIEEMQKAGTAP